MNSNEVVPAIIGLCKDGLLSFPQKTESIAAWLKTSPVEAVLEHLDDGGIIPECFGHDSTEEKLFAKYCDALLAAAWVAMGMEADVITERADAADAIGRLDGYTIVGDAKAFRLSRTAKNQKDFKIEALDKWRKGAEFACLAAPLYQFPNSNSQIYLQASRYNVTILSYTHLAFLIRHRPTDLGKLKLLWQAAGTLEPSKNATAYWSLIEKTVCEITGTTQQDWNDAVKKAADRLPHQAAEHIAFWEQEKLRINALPHDVVTVALIKALKIDSKIALIKKNFREAKKTTETHEKLP